jgi:rubrerythrin
MAEILHRIAHPGQRTSFRGTLIRPDKPTRIGSRAGRVVCWGLHVSKLLYSIKLDGHVGPRSRETMTELNKTLYSGLRAAFVSEAMTAQRYTYFAQVAEIEGRVQIAQVFTELAESATCAAHGHIDFLQHFADPATEQPIGETQLNVASAVIGELYEATELYPELVVAARAEGLADVASWLTTMCALKRAHVARLKQVLDALSEPFAASGASTREDEE